MKKKDWNFDLWCRRATETIAYRPDRKRAFAELRAHLEDAYEVHASRGLSPDEAEQKALESMGSAQEVAAKMAAVYKPFWGNVIKASQIMLVILLVFSLIPIWKHFTVLLLEDKSHPVDFALYDAASYGGDTGRTLHHLSKPDVSFRSDGNQFTVTDAGLYTEYSSYQEKDVTRLYLLVQQKSLLPAKEHYQYGGLFNFSTPISAFFIRDDRGNTYELHSGTRRTTSSVRTGLFTQSHVCWINNFPSDAQWAELCYERDGRSFSLRIDLTGGDYT